MIEELISRAFAARDIAHREHLLTKSYAQHMALNGFYDAVVDAADAVAEFYIGMFGELDSFDVKTQKVKDIQAFLQDEADWIEAHREELAHGSDALGNLIDNLSAVYAKALYMLRMQ